MHPSTHLEQHVSELQLDEYLAALHDGPGEPFVLEHVRQCHLCTQRLQRRVEQCNAFLSRAPTWRAFVHTRARAEVPRQDKPSSRRKVVLSLATAAISVAAAAVLTLGDKPVPTTSTGTRSKGARRLSIFVKRGDDIHRVASGDTVQASDALGFLVDTPTASFFALLHRDASSATVLFPTGPDEQGRTMLSLAGGTAVPLDFSFVLDDEGGYEELSGLFCTEPLSSTTLERLAHQSEVVPAHCQRDSLRLTKLPPAR